jgi:FAD/FMN-containing dehydrogenase
MATVGSRVPWGRLRRAVSGTLALPGDGGYDRARRVENPRYDTARPLAVLQVADARDVAAALAFAHDHDVPLAIRSGGHSYPGFSAGGGPGTGTPPALVIDCRRLAGVTLDGTTARIGSGASLAVVYDALGRRDRALAGGSCATVGIGGLTQGGGVGVLTRAFGLTCDAVSAMEVVTADGRVRTVDGEHDPDLFWALRGGGGGHAGVVTRFTFRTHAAPTISTFHLVWPLASAPAVIAAWQQWAPSADPRLWSTLKALGGTAHPGGPAVSVSGTWIGPPGRLAHQLGRLLAGTPAPTARSSGVHDFRTVMATYAGCAAIPVQRCHTGPGGALQRQAFAATSHVAYRPLAGAGVTALLDRVDDARAAGLHEAGASLDALGGRVGDLAPGDTAFVHRRALMTVQYTATYDGRRRTAAAQRFVRGLRSALVPSWGNTAYVNYADTAVRHHRTAYFGANAARLAAVKRAYDPDGLFAQPQGW